MKNRTTKKGPFRSDLVQIDDPAQIDHDVLLGYISPRPSKSRRLIVGPESRLRSGTVLYAGTRIGARFETGHHVVVRENNRFGDDVKIWNNSTVDYGCHLGDRVKVHCNCYVAQFSKLQDDVFLAPGVTFANDLYPGDKRSSKNLCGPTLGERVQIGVNATILPFVRIGDGTVVGAGSVVTNDLPAGVVAWGNPARVYKRVKDLRVPQRLALLNRRCSRP